MESPWNSLDQVNAHAFAAGDTIRLRRGSECWGSLAPRGSGAPGDPIRLTAYGRGLRPRIVAPASADAVLRLFNQEYWEIDSLDLSGANTFGISIGGDKGILHHLWLANLAVHDVVGEGLKHKESGLVVISPKSVDEHFDDVRIDGVTAWNSRQWAGILVGGGDLGFPPESTWSTNVVIRNSTVHDVQGDGIVLFRVRHGQIETSVAWDTGMQNTESIGTPNAIWTWMCDDCTVRQNEAFLSDSPGVDGGAYDIDYGNTQNAVVDNYGHDTQGYCVAVFGAGFVTRTSIVSGNLCIDNGRSPRMAKYQGAIFLLSWNNGLIDGLTIEKNTVYWNPLEDAPALINNAAIRPGRARFRNNTIYSTSPRIVESNAALSAAHNHYSYFGSGRPRWLYGSEQFNELPTGGTGTAHEEAGSDLTQRPEKEWQNGLAPPSPSSLPRFVAGVTFGQGWKSLQGEPFSFPRNYDRWHLYSELPFALNRNGLPADDVLRQVVVLRSLAAQYEASGLRLTLLLNSAGGDLRDALGDLALSEAEIAWARRKETEKLGMRTVLVTPDGHVADQWTAFAGPVELGLLARRWMGMPVFSQMAGN
jgi:hypothetical protein